MNMTHWLNLMSKNLPIFNLYLPEFSHPPNTENLRSHSINSNDIVNPVVKMRPHPSAHPY